MASTEITTNHPLDDDSRAMENIQLKPRNHAALSSSDADHEIHRNKNGDQCKMARKYFREHNEVTGIHCIRYLTEKRSRGEKIFWGIILILSLIGCIYMVCEIVEKYINSPVVLAFQSEYSSIYDIPFPAVTICPESRTSSSSFNITAVNIKAKRHEKLTSEETIGLSYTSRLCEGDLYETKPDLDYFNEDFYRFIDKHKTLEDVPSVEFMNKEYEFSELFVPVITEYGVCYSFNIFDRMDMFRENAFQYKNFQTHQHLIRDFDGEIGFKENSPKDTFPKRTSLCGLSHSLKMMIILDDADEDYSCSIFQGLSFLIHSPWVYPGFSRKIFHLPPDRAVSASIKPDVTRISEEVKSYSPERRKCYLRNERPLKFYKIYTQSSCLSECLANFTLRLCGCVDFYMPHDYNTSICGPAKFQCMDEATENITRDNNEKSCDCKPTCTDLSYNVEISQAPFDIRRYAALRKDEEEGDVFHLLSNKHMKYAMLTLYFESPQFLALERNELYGITDLISNIGGLLGLFTGFSLLTMIEIIYFLSLRIYCNYKLYGQWHGADDL